MSEHRPGQWPVKKPVDLGAIEQAPEDELYMRRAAERARREIVLGGIRADLEEQPSSNCVLSAARSWCADVTAMADEIARQLRSAA